MPNFSLKQKIIAAVVALGLILIAIFNFGLSTPSKDESEATPEAAVNEARTDKVVVVSTNPANLDGATILPTQPIEITFNLPLENEPELKRQWDPEDTDVKTELSSDRKTVKFTPNKPLIFGEDYTLTIKVDTKFEGQKRLDNELIYHIKTISYSGV
jgi:hypothetical protein